MDVIDILGGLLNRRSGSSDSVGGKILKDVLGGGERGQTTARHGEPQFQRPPGSPRIVPPSDPGAGGATAASRGSAGTRDTERRDSGAQLDSLEDLLRHAHRRSRGEQTAPHGQTAERDTPMRQPAPSAGSASGSPAPRTDDASGLNSKTELIVRAMINAARADGRIDQAEQEAIIRQIGGTTPDKIQFLRNEFAQALNLRDFVWSVPLGMEQEIYAISLMSMHAFSDAERRYLQDLAHGFRLTPDLCSRIHQRFGVSIMG